MIIEFREKSDKYFGILGGAPFIETLDICPLIPGTEKRMTLLMTLFSNMKGDSFDDSLCISILISFDRGAFNTPKLSLIDKYKIQSNKDLSLLKRGYTKAIIHKKSHVPINIDNQYLFPKYFMETRNFTDNENERQQELMDEKTMGLDSSVFMGVPFFEQEDVSPEPSAKYRPIIQIDEWDLNDLSKEFTGIFDGGFGYFFMDNNFKRIQVNKEIGYFFVQS